MWSWSRRISRIEHLLEAVVVKLWNMEYRVMIDLSKLKAAVDAVKEDINIAIDKLNNLPVPEDNTALQAEVDAIADGLAAADEKFDAIGKAAVEPAPEA